MKVGSSLPASCMLSVMHPSYSFDLPQIIVWSAAAVMLFGYIAWRGIKDARRRRSSGGGDVMSLGDGGGGHGGGGHGGDCGGGGDGGGCH